jgi:hypothetical protein
MVGIAVTSTLILVASAQAQPMWRLPDQGPVAGQVDPNIRPYGPGTYSENGFTVYIPANCYVSREQVLLSGRLVWRPIRTCPSPGYR